MEYLKKMAQIEKYAGSKTKAAALAGVSLNTWSRWSNQRINPHGKNNDMRSATIIDLLCEKLTLSTPPAGDHEPDNGGHISTS